MQQTALQRLHTRRSKRQEFIKARQEEAKPLRGPMPTTRSRPDPALEGIYTYRTTHKSLLRSSSSGEGACEPSSSQYFKLPSWNGAGSKDECLEGSTLHVAVHRQTRAAARVSISCAQAEPSLSGTPRVLQACSLTRPSQGCSCPVWPDCGTPTHLARPPASGVRSAASCGSPSTLPVSLTWPSQPEKPPSYDRPVRQSTNLRMVGRTASSGRCGPGYARGYLFWSGAPTKGSVPRVWGATQPSMPTPHFNGYIESP